MESPPSPVGFIHPFLLRSRLDRRLGRTAVQVWDLLSFRPARSAQFSAVVDSPVETTVRFEFDESFGGAHSGARCPVSRGWLFPNGTVAPCSIRSAENHDLSPVRRGDAGAERSPNPGGRATPGLRSERRGARGDHVPHSI